MDLSNCKVENFETWRSCVLCYMWFGMNGFSILGNMRRKRAVIFLKEGNVENLQQKNMRISFTMFPLALTVLREISAPKGESVTKSAWIHFFFSLLTPVVSGLLKTPLGIGALISRQVNLDSIDGIFIPQFIQGFDPEIRNGLLRNCHLCPYQSVCHNQIK